MPFKKFKRKEEQEYESVDVGEKQYTNKRAAPELVVADAPNAPRFGGKGLQGNATYQFEDAKQQGSQAPEENEVRKGRASPSIPQTLLFWLPHIVLNR